MPSFTEDHPGPDTEVADTTPISGTGLRIPSLLKTLHASATGPVSPPDGTTLKQYRAPVAKVTARPPIQPLSSMPSALGSQSSAKHDASVGDETEQNSKGDEDPQMNLFHQVSEWLQHEKVRRKNRKARRAEAASSGATEATPDSEDYSIDEAPQFSESTFSLDKLEKILLHYSGARTGDGLSSLQPIKRAVRRRPKGLRRGSASESDVTDIEAPVPSVEAVLDNSKTLAYTGGAAEEESTESSTCSKRLKDQEAWLTFKTDIVRIAHTMQLRGWRKVSMEAAGDIRVIRLSGALTNAVYVVEPPKQLPVLSRSNNGSAPVVSRKPPPKLLLRIYGPQVDHLIDREKELQILRRLGRKNIGPRVLGTFLNGRFEEFFEARPLTPRELRLPETAKQIAKRMRELHDGIELLEEEREGGPVIFKNWDKWVDRCEQVTTWLDKELLSPENEAKAAVELWRRRGYVCGVPWEIFRKAVDNYRMWLIASCGGISEIKRQLVFAHNDTQYGNLLRMEPATQSPLLLPANEHKQLVVIDFEYSSANTPGLEFANHFTEWCYNYHDEELPWACNNRLYPTPEEQHRFVATYLTHRPAIPGGPASPLATPSATPFMRGGRSTTSITPLNLDDGPEGPLGQQLEASGEDELESQVRYLMHQTRLWRVMNSAQWVAWGIVQAKVPGMDEGITEMTAASGNDSSEHETHSDGNGEHKTPPVDPNVDEEEEEFDYLAYSQDRAMFFWSDLLALGLVNPDDLPAPMVEHIRARAVDY
ncbi:putative choline kinase [Penicillium brasilianum]|uniref:Putative choline kinase n=1 Tax=Penicillium brasilianum TaxID=104259 RepID=A0A1S9RQE7_PENBI|nr:putative choline kinase [Penicillium brasilianum]